MPHSANRLQENLHKLEDSPLYVIQQAELLLVLLGYKPATNLHIFSQPYPPGYPPQTVHPMDRHETEELLQTLELPYHVHKPQVLKSSAHHREVIDFSVADSTENLELMMEVWNVGPHATPAKPFGQPQNARLFGQLSGYPDTAVEAYVAGDLLPEAEEPDHINSDKYAYRTYRLSRDHWQYELATALRWAEAVQFASPRIHHEYLRVRRATSDQ